MTQVLVFKNSNSKFYFKYFNFYIDFYLIKSKSFRNFKANVDA